MSYIISSEWLNDHLNSDDTAIIDVRFQMDTPEAGYQTYEAGHIPHAIYLDLNQDLSGPAGKHGGQRPLPDIDTFAQKLGDNGIDQGKTIVIYDQGIGMFAARAWRSEEHTSELQSRGHIVCRLLLERKKKI